MIAQADLFPEVRLHPEDDTDERYTPWALILEEQRLLGRPFTLDVAATAESAKAPQFYRKADNALLQPWHGDVWCNPPFSDIEPWVAKAWREIRGNAFSITMLLPAWTDRGWWATHVEPWRDGRGGDSGPTLQTAFLPGRVRFGIPGNPNRGGNDSPPFWCVLLRWRR